MRQYAAWYTTADKIFLCTGALCRLAWVTSESRWREDKCYMQAYFKNSQLGVGTTWLKQEREGSAVVP